MMNPNAVRVFYADRPRNETIVNWVRTYLFLLKGQGVKSRFLLSLILSILAEAAWPQSAEIVPPASVIHEGIPPVPASLGTETSPYRRSLALITHWMGSGETSGHHQRLLPGRQVCQPRG